MEGIQLGKHECMWGDTSGLQSMHEGGLMRFTLRQPFIRTPKKSTETQLQAASFSLASIIMVGVCASFLFLKEPFTHFLKVANH